MAETLRITRLGHAGDGVADAESGPVFVAFTLPGETVTAEVDGDRADLLRVAEASADRVAPPCPHYGACGGCSLQHWSLEAYHGWKREQVVMAFAQRGLEPEVAQIIACAPKSRRRAVLTAERSGKVVTVGFNRAASHALVAVPECHVLVPEIVQRLPQIEALIAPFIPQRRRPRVTIVSTNNGLDIAIDDCGRVNEQLFDRLAARISDPAIARVTVSRETVYQAREPEIVAGPVALLPVPGGFIQAVATAEAAMSTAVRAGVGPAKKVADLFCGIGTFTFRLAKHVRVAAMDGDAASIAALQKAANRTQGLKPLKAEKRDLFTDPLTTVDLKRFDAVVFDPPRAGAKAQAEQLAGSAVPRVVAVSCNPATLARDARILVDGGYRITSVQPIDQFLWSAHIEVVATFER